ncbi:HpcH/HpaI aldolase/citrate lyase family protein [Herbaspirillum sp. NPDC087042]|uniref:HpcH/HpaI aldolase/citrate lyase family protein n=1 Tax=Herbaspirillum sp. NPDC087042 TaxID=3364004 RepID=UPI00382F58EB
MTLSTAPSCRPPALRRSWLFTAGADRQAHQRALASGADVLVPDLEEFTAPQERAQARIEIVALMARCRTQGMVAGVRINRLAGAGHDDLSGVMPGRPDVVLLPYVESAAEIAALDAAMGALEMQLGIAPGNTEIVPTIESALGIVQLQPILAASARVRACLLAAEDLTADLGAERGPDSVELNYLRNRFHVECRAAGRIAIDCPFNYRDPDWLAADLAWARRIGLRAKCTVLPEQVAAIHTALTPSPEQVASARELVARFEAMRRGDPGTGVAIDTPDYHTARRLLARDAEFRNWGA